MQNKQGINEEVFTSYSNSVVTSRENAVSGSQFSKRGGPSTR